MMEKRPKNQQQKLHLFIRSKEVHQKSNRDNWNKQKQEANLDWKYPAAYGGFKKKKKKVSVYVWTPSLRRAYAT